LNGPGWRKPKGMHQRTYERLSAEVEEWTALSLAGMMQRFGVGLAACRIFSATN
jgi:hypothetical protein